jgi:hypothetical protein
MIRIPISVNPKLSSLTGMVIAGILPSIMLAGGLPSDPREWACANSLIPVPQTEINQWCQDHPNRGLPLPEELRSPPPISDLEAKNRYDLRMGAFLKTLRYKQDLGWMHDSEWRFTGPIVGPVSNPSSYATHLPVRVYYSPEVIDWMCNGRQGELPEGAAIIKEMHTIPSLDVAIGDDGCMDIVSTLPGDDIPPLAWVPMVKRSSASKDGWYWAGHQVEIQVNLPGAQVDPPIFDRSGISRPDFYQQGMPPQQPDPAWYPSGYWPENKQKYPNVITPLNAYGSFCLACHSSAEKDFTFASLENVMGYPIRYKQFDAEGSEPHPTDRFLHTPPGFVDYYLEHLLGEIEIPTASGKRQTPFASPLTEPDPAFIDFYDQLNVVPFADAWSQRLPAQTYDHLVSGAGGADSYLTSDQCAGCHDALNFLDSESNMKLDETVAGVTQSLNLSEWGEWSTSPMGLAGRDPIFYSQLQSETNTLPQHTECIENTCLHCHAVMGQRQLAHDTPGESNPACAQFFGVAPPPGVPSGRSFTLAMVHAWPGEPGDADPAYGALARDGISCTACHRISTQSLGEESTYTGNFVAEPPDQVKGPFRQVSTTPMKNALGITPGFGEQISRSEMCGSCHAILLPVFTNQGVLQRYSYEQTTYLEWQNSDFNLGTQQTTCQDCHMPTHYKDKALRFKIANIESADFPPTRNRLPDKDIELTPREPYARHSLHGVNVFLNQMFQQFPLLLGYRQGTFFNVGSEGRPTLTLGQESMLDMAANQSARLEISKVKTTGSGKLIVDVQVNNLAGHFLPSGVGFRRMFLEFLVKDANGELLWASGRTNSLGAILDGTSDRVLPSEQPVKFPDAPFQPHYQIIRKQDQVQIYQELVKDSDGKLTTSFLRRFEKVKDNRIRPKGFLPARFRASDSAFIRELAKTPGEASHDPDYNNPNRTGGDAITYMVQLDPKTLARVASVEVSLQYQSIPPFYLQQRFRDAQHVSKSSPEIERLYYMTSHLNTTGDDDSPGTAAIRNWKLTLASASQSVRPQ